MCKKTNKKKSPLADLASSQNASLPTKSANPEHAKWLTGIHYLHIFDWAKIKSTASTQQDFFFLCFKESGAVMVCDFSGHLVSFRVIGTFYVAEKCLQYLYATDKHVYTQINSTFVKKVLSTKLTKQIPSFKKV